MLVFGWFALMLQCSSLHFFPDLSYRVTCIVIDVCAVALWLGDRYLVIAITSTLT